MIVRAAIMPASVVSLILAVIPHNNRYVKSFARGYRCDISAALYTNAIGDDELRSGVQMKQAPRLSSAAGGRLRWLVEGHSRPLATVQPSRVQRCLMMADCGGARWIVLGCSSPCLQQRLREVGIEFLER